MVQVVKAELICSNGVGFVFGDVSQLVGVLRSSLRIHRLCLSQIPGLVSRLQVRVVRAGRSSSLLPQIGGDCPFFNWFDAFFFT